MTKLMRRVTSLFVLALLPACASYEIVRGTPFDDLAGAEKNVVVRVVEPPDGSYDGKTASGSGSLVARRIEQAVSKRFPNVAATKASAAAAPGRTLEIAARLLHWEDRATNWSGKSDKVQIQLELRDLPSGKGRVLTYDAASSWFTFVNNPPQDLLNREFDAAVNELLPVAPGGDR
ncbi:MAG: hypothetical protein ACI89X_000465 [Planctomycetota bacterium]|jgi:hypothetical protein